MYTRPVKNAILVCLHVTTEAGPPLVFPQCHLYGLYKSFSNMNVPSEVKRLALLLDQDSILADSCLAMLAPYACSVGAGSCSRVRVGEGYNQVAQGDLEISVWEQEWGKGWPLRGAGRAGPWEQGRPGPSPSSPPHSQGHLSPSLSWWLHGLLHELQG